MYQSADLNAMLANVTSVLEKRPAIAEITELSFWHKLQSAAQS